MEYKAIAADESKSFQNKCKQSKLSRQTIEEVDLGINNQSYDGRQADVSFPRTNSNAMTAVGGWMYSIGGCSVKKRSTKMEGMPCLALNILSYPELVSSEW